MIDPQILQELFSLDLPKSKIKEVLAIIDKIYAKQEERLANQRLRSQRYRNKTKPSRDGNVTVTSSERDDRIISNISNGTISNGKISNGTTTNGTISNGSKVLIEQEYKQLYEKIWLRKGARSRGLKHYIKARRHVTAEVIQAGALAYLETVVDPGYCMYLANWISDKGWNDVTDSKVTPLPLAKPPSKNLQVQLHNRAISEGLANGSIPIPATPNFSSEGETGSEAKVLHALGKSSPEDVPTDGQPSNGRTDHSLGLRHGTLF